MDISTDYVHALSAARNSERSGATMKEIIHAIVVSHQIIPDIMLECPLLAHSWSLDDLLQLNETTKQCVEQCKIAV